MLISKLGNRQSITTSRRQKHKKQKKSRQKQHQANKDEMPYGGILCPGPV